MMRVLEFAQILGCPQCIHCELPPNCALQRVDKITVHREVVGGVDNAEGLGGVPFAN